MAKKSVKKTVSVPKMSMRPPVLSEEVKEFSKPSYPSEMAISKFKESVEKENPKRERLAQMVFSSFSGMTSQITYHNARQCSIIVGGVEIGSFMVSV